MEQEVVRQVEAWIVFVTLIHAPAYLLLGAGAMWAPKLNKLWGQLVQYVVASHVLCALPPVSGPIVLGWVAFKLYQKAYPPPKKKKGRKKRL